ncbi:hypothetical protein [Povalibacter sp.]|uniref:hypothetical protein n=1 Tax=Povalibacter sp. TaxID=1962978 RepID=UPI002F422029
MQYTTELSIELSDQELVDLPETITLHDRSSSKGLKPGTHAVHASADYDLIEIELTPEEMDQLLSG